MSQNDPAPRDRSDRAILPIILIAAGVLLLLGRVGLFDWGLALGVLSLWPLLLIAVGVDILTQGRYRIVVVLATVAIGALLWRAPGWVPGAPGPAETHEIAYELAGARSAEIELGHGVGSLNLSALPEGSELVLGGTIATGSNERLDAGYRVDDGVAEVELISEQRGPSFSVFGVRNERRVWDLELTREAPIELHIESGVGESRLDLREVTLSALDLDAGVGEVLVILPARGGYEGEIDAGVGEVIVRIPDDVEARMEIDTGLGGIDARGAWIRSGDEFLSDGFEDAPAERRVDLRISGGVGEITIERID